MPILASRTSQMFGTAFTPIALQIAAVRQGSGEPLVVSAILFASFVPAIVFGPPVGAVVERWDKRRTMLWAQLSRVFVLLLVLASTSVEMFVAVAFLMGISEIFYRPAYRALLPEIAAGADLHVRATGLINALEKLGSLTGVALGTLIVLAVGVRVAFVLDAAVLGLSALSVLAVPRWFTGKAVGQVAAGIWRGMMDGFRAARERRLARDILLGAGLVTLGMVMINPLLVLIPRDLLHAPVWWFGVFEFVQGGAMAVFGGLIASGLPMSRRSLILAGFLGSGLSALALGLSRSAPLDVVIYVFLGFANMAWLSPVLALYRLDFPLALRARGGAVYSMVVGVAQAAGVAAGGLVASLLSVEAGLVVAGLWGVAVAVLVAALGLLRTADPPPSTGAAATSLPA